MSARLRDLDIPLDTKVVVFKHVKNMYKVKGVDEYIQPFYLHFYKAVV